MGCVIAKNWWATCVVPLSIPQVDTGKHTGHKNCCQKGSSNRMLHTQVSFTAIRLKYIYFYWYLRFKCILISQRIFPICNYTQIRQVLLLTDIQKNASWRHNLVSLFLYPYFLNYEWFCVYFSLMFQKCLIFVLALITFPFYSYNSQLIFLYNLRTTMYSWVFSLH